MKNIGKIALNRAHGRWKSSVDEDEPSDEEYEFGVNALSYFIRGYFFPLEIARIVVLQSDNYGERTLAVYILESSGFNDGFIEACQFWLRMPEWESWRILIKVRWANSTDLTVYHDTVFLDSSRMEAREVFQRIRG